VWGRAGVEGEDLLVFAVENELQEARAGESAGGPTEVDRRVRGPDVVDCDKDGRQLTVSEGAEVKVADGHRGGLVDVRGGPGRGGGGGEGAEAGEKHIVGGGIVRDEDEV